MPSAASCDGLCLRAGNHAARGHGYLSLLQAEFCIRPSFWTESSLPLPYWVLRFSLLSSAPGGDFEEHQVIIDASDGSVLEITSPGAAANG